MEVVNDVLPREKRVIECKERSIERLGIVYKERTKSHYPTCRVFCDCKHNENSCIVDISFAMFNPEHCVMILFGKSYIQFCKMEIFEQ